MKKSLLLISLCVVALSANAQNTAFKVQSNGKIAIQTNNTALSPISINCTGDSTYYMYCLANGKNGLYLRASATGPGINSGINYGLRGHAEYATTSIGVKGSAGSATKAIGLLGDISNFTYGAAIYGAVNDGLAYYFTPGTYAGFFHGNVKVVGNVTANNLLPGTLLGESASSSANGPSLRSASITSSLSGLNITTYQKERPEIPEITETIYDDLDIDTLQRGKEPEPDILDEQYYGKTHYALDADRLEESFPDLVYIKEDGSKVINYMEMIPLLVQSINELNAKIEVLEGQVSEGAAKKTRSATNKKASPLTQNRLYQNTPNPFKEQTVIRFSLADDVQNAAICIFDMTGKTIKKMPVSSGIESVSVGGYELGEGMFLYSLVVNGQEIDTKKMIISK
ncbi:MAG: T9SS type A sorting domain-containing protein [Prevotella sp.]|nr:T9SS type A sorting domain-containing protein [Prevotella sp.]